jgi:hypothetical protein
MMDARSENWTRITTSEFWNSLGPTEHVVEIYDDDRSYINLLEGFGAGGFAVNDCVVVIGTEEHLQAYEDRLRFKGHNVFELKLQDQYVPLNAHDTLNEFMIKNWPDEVLFKYIMKRHMARARTMKRNVRVFAEMSSLLWTLGNIGGTVQLEHLWNELCQREGISLFSMYPEKLFPQSALESILDICGSNARMIKLPTDSSYEILYREMRYRDRSRQRAS